MLPMPCGLPSASCVVSSSRALSGCIQLASHKELRDLKLDTVRMLLLEDGANPCELAYMYYYLIIVLLTNTTSVTSYIW